MTKCTCATCPVHRRAKGWWPMLIPLAVLLASCGGKVEHDPRGITNVTCWVECVRFYGGSKECVVIDSADDLYDTSFWSKVEAIAASHACPALPEEHALVGNGE